MTSTTGQDRWQRLLRRVDATGEHVTDGFPHYGDPSSSAMGVRITRGINLAGFFKRHVLLEGR
jgi:hypothetical protein